MLPNHPISTMRKPLHKAGIVLLLLYTQLSQAQTKFIWSSSFSPAWSNGSTNNTATNVGGTSINCNVNTVISGDGTFKLALGSYGSQTPTVSGATFVVPESISSLQITPEYENENSYANIVFTFSSLVSGVSFKIADIDKYNIGSSPYYDRVIITGSDGVRTYNASIEKYDPLTDPTFLIVNGNTASVNTLSGFAGNAESDDRDQRGTINVSFGNAVIRTITIRYDNVPEALPFAGAVGAQAIGIGDITFNTVTLAQNFLNFSGRRRGTEVSLEWKTQNETGISSYIVERNSGTDWQAIGSINAINNNTLSTSYSFTDAAASGSLLLYRLKQVTNSTNFKYSGIVRITDKENGISLLAYPNPFTEQVNININSTTRQQVLLAIYDAGGRAGTFRKNNPQ